MARAIIDNDLRYSRRVTADDAKDFAHPEDTLYRFRKTIGHFFEDEL